MTSPDRLDWSRHGADWPHRAASRFLSAGGVDWHVQVMGEGPAVLLLHGVGGAGFSWRGAAPLVAEAARVIVPDLPGHGFSGPARRGARGLPGMAAALGALLAALDARPAVIVGHSAGAAIAARMTLDGAAAPRALVAFNGAFLPFKGLAGLLFPPMAKLLALNPLAPRAMAWGADRATVARLMDAMGGADAQGQALYRRLFASPAHVAGALGMMAEWDLPPLARALPRLSVPLELAVGEADRAVPPSDAREVARRAPRARLHPLPGLGHLAHEQRPDTAAVLIRNALTENAPPAT